ncbi:hypothetical protein ACFV8T_22110 [Streptomyces sp. NPDC059832]|uniref:hypothetical protein n=1 Tax=Streptomyces sp. NPDC059832 TaxID=3346966 RepID=UPI00365406A6
MHRTTPPRPVDITEEFPDLAPLARTAVRLHPRPGRPAVEDSSVGGPLRWPRDEPWPTCPEHVGPWHLGFAPDEVRAERRVLTAAWARAEGNRLILTPQEREVVDRAGYSGRRIPQNGPVPLLAVAQLYARDLQAAEGDGPWPGPRATDLLQVLWCPFDHGDDCLPRVRLVWRRAAEVGPPLTTPPEPSVIGNGNYLPGPCLLHPERVTEYPAPHELDEALAERVRAWEEEHDYLYQGALSVAPGWKLGGWGNWSFCDPWPMECPDCGGGVRPLLTVDSGEWDNEMHWRPVEDEAADAAPGVVYPQPQEPTQVTIGRGCTMQVYSCERSFGHTALQVMQ